ncbi:LAMI_0C09472g1_1 [Lachancea mirantina]|uniref:LAMI_0C09472g1_1 n=1 Tax=Lachancea mirantina TaxID=1230905 RepID=A0A1G4J557_9SACH|nr:LAMI_0C09472g1_1 [Lachancea mirantina]
MSSLNVEVKSDSLSDGSKPDNGDQVVTVFDLASEIEQSINSIVKQVEKNDKEFEARYDTILKTIESLEEQ